MASQEYIEALELAAEIYGTSTLELERVLTEVGAPYTAETVENLWLNTGSLAGSDLRVVNTASGKPLYYTATSRGTIANAANSNISKTGSITYPVNTTVADPLPTAPISFKAGMREAGKFTLNSVVPAIAATGLGITLGKTIDSALYNANPDFWDAHNMSSLNPDTWNDITSDYDGVAGTLFNLIFGLDPDTGETQAYIDENAAAYLAWYMAESGVFVDGKSLDGKPLEVGTTITKSDFVYMTGAEFVAMQGIRKSSGMSQDTFNRYLTQTGVLGFSQRGSNLPFLFYVDNNDIGIPDSYTGNIDYYYSSDLAYGVKPVIPTRGRYLSQMYRNNDGTLGSGITSGISSVSRVTNVQRGQGQHTFYVGKLIEPIAGIGTQDGATTPNTSGWNDVDATKQSLQNQYPDLWNNAKHYDLVNPDGTTTSRTYIPINLPVTNSKDDTKPNTGDRTQGDPTVNPDSPSPLTELITQLITRLTPDNPAPTGEGDSPIVPAPTGSASSLWAVYNPTQAQVDAFGAWLWSSDLVEQIKKLFNDPMQAIIGIHKVFATPSTGAAQNIKCGYIDSGVPSAVVTSQYTTIDCGTVNLREYFGNVFDYSPYTEVSLYLPFIGIVKLDVSDVMRASITVKYHVDVITGACLADVIVNRDAAGGVLYQYSGSAIVTYPISSGSYASAMAGVISIAGGLIGTALTGGAAAPALLGAAVGASHLHSDVQKSGSFSGAAGAMGAKIPYLIISRPQTAMPSSYRHLEGQPTNYYTKLSSASGYVKVKAVQVKGINATDTELDMIDAALRQGVEL